MLTPVRSQTMPSALKLPEIAAQRSRRRSSWITNTGSMMNLASPTGLQPGPGIGLFCSAAAPTERDTPAVAERMVVRIDRES